MIVRIAGSPYIHNQSQTSRIMMVVCLALLPSIVVQFWFFGWGTIFQILLGCSSALAAETLALMLRKKAIKSTLSDNSALLTGLLLALSIPPLTVWWMVILGTVFAVIVAKQMYGGLGNNLFNPAMVGYVVLLISFPVQMTSWLTPHKFAASFLGFMDTLQIIFSNHNATNNTLVTFSIGIDGISQATPLDKFRILPHVTHSTAQFSQYYNYTCDLANVGWLWINFSYLIGGLFLLWQRVICWHIPTSFLITLAIYSTIGWICLPDLLASPQTHLLSGATMIGAFFILTDPVTASTTNCGRLIFGALASLLVWLIRSFGGYPDGVAFSALLINLTVPLIDYYTRPHVYGYR